MRFVFFAVFVLAALPLRAETVYSIGVVPQFEPRKLASIWMPIIHELEERTKLKFQLKGSKNIPGFEAGLAEGAFDFAYMNPYHATTANRDQGYQPLVRDGGRSLYGILVVRKDSPLQDVKELNGAQVAFPSPNALGASLLMRAELDRSEGISITPKYVQTHSSVYLHVLLGQTPAGGGVMGTFNQQSAEIRHQLRTLYVTRDMPPHPFGVHPRVPRGHQLLVQQALVDMAATDYGAELLAKVPFKKLIGSSYDDYAPLVEWGLEDYYVLSE
ncbi:phosphate/phosphite/phosphonate ABC transporter substrate-binding protein [Pseudomonadota bacterium]